MTSYSRRCLHPILLVLALVCASCTPHELRSGTLLPSRSIELAEKRSLVDVRKVIPGIDIDLRYATANNVSGHAIYPADMPCLLRSETAEKLKQAQAILRAQGYGLRIWDAYRPPEAQESLHQSGGSTGMFLSPNAGWSRHCGGIAVDLTLVDAQGREQRMPTGFDRDFAHASKNYRGADPVVKQNLQVLQAAMKQAGFTQLESEWWHFDDTEYVNNPQPVVHGWQIALPRDVTAVSIRNNATFTVIDETDGYIVVNKPAPLQIHPGDPKGPPTLWHRVCDLLSYEIANGGQVSIINRLDRETSGVVLIAKNHDLARLFGMAMQERKIHKTYVALVHGWPEWEELTLDAPILNARDVQAFDIWVKQIVHPQGAECRTAFRTLQRFERDGEKYALVEAKPETGRMHQIRVHLHHLGLPIVGDKLYGRSDRCYLEFIETGWTEALADRLILPRQALHSSRLELNLEGFPPCWEAPLPPEFEF